MQGIDFGALLISLAVLLCSLSVHEAAHAWVADRLGDPTARRLGRVSLNPAVHIDPIGTLLLPILAAVSGLPIIGWAKPVPVNGRNLRNYRRDFLFIAAAGPASNLLLAVLASVAFRFAPIGAASIGDVSVGSLLQHLIVVALQINVLLAVFNMIPVPPLDGGNVLAGLLPRDLANRFDALRPFGFIVLYGLMLTGILSALIMPPTRFLLGLLTGGSF